MSPLFQTLGAASVRAFGFTRGSAGGGGSMTLISTQVLASTTASVTFSSIPQTYKHLQLRVTGRTDRASTIDSAILRFNADATSGNYPYHGLYGNGTSVASENALTFTGIYGPVLPGASITANVFSAGVTDILDYTSTTKNKTTRALDGFAGGTNYIYLQSGAWLSTSAVTSITVLSVNAANFAIGSRFSLYGVLG